MVANSANCGIRNSAGTETHVAWHAKCNFRRLLLDADLYHSTGGLAGGYAAPEIRLAMDCREEIDTFSGQCFIHAA
jgi:hypothetical protein